MSSSEQKKKKGNGADPPAAAGAATAPAVAPQDTRLLSFIRTNAPRICAGLTLGAAQAAADRNYAEMQSLTSIATQLGNMTGQTLKARAQAAAAGAGGGGGSVTNS